MDNNTDQLIETIENNRTMKKRQWITIRRIQSFTFKISKYLLFHQLPKKKLSNNSGQQNNLQNRLRNFSE